MAQAAAARGRVQFQGEQIAAALPPLLVAADRVASTVAQGVHGRRRVGQGDSFWQFRQYQPGDAPQRIDWRESAKSQRVYVRETEWEAAQSVWLWRDFSASMDYASSRELPTKRQRAEILLVALVALLVRGGERATLLGSGLPPLSGRVALSRLAALVERPGAAGQSLPPAQSLPRYAQVVLIGDFLSPLPEIQAALAGFAASGARGHILQVLDPAEETLPFDGRVRFEDLEAAGDVLISRVEAVREEYVARVAAHRDGLAQIARGFGWSIATHHTDRSPQSALLALYTAMSHIWGK
jgi:uncharacterized protein (DUF58 family)